jgi:hypothetical protein
MVPMPNTAKPRLRRICGRPPIFGQGVTATYSALPTPGVTLSFGAATDQSGGERDAVRYVIWRREVGVPDWGDPHLTLGPNGTSYAVRDNGVVSGRQYEYQVAVQDCTPNVSAPSVSNSVVIP